MERPRLGYSVYLLYWYKTTNTDAAGGAERWLQMRCFAPSASGAQAAMTREEKMRALQDADRTRADRDRVIFAAALVADYLAVSWTDKLLPSSNPSLAHTTTHTHTRFLQPLARRLRCVMPAT